MTPETWALISTMGGWGVVATIILTLWQFFSSGKAMFKWQHDAILSEKETQLKMMQAQLAAAQASLEASHQRERDLRIQAAEASAAVAQLTGLLLPDRRHDDKGAGARALGAP